MKYTLVTVRILAMVAILFSLQNAHAVLQRAAQVIVVNGNGTLVNATATEGWTGTSANITATNGSGSLNGVPLGLVASAGDKAEINNVDAVATYNQLTTNTTGATPWPPSVQTNLYFSFLYQFRNAADVSNTVEHIAREVRNGSSSGINFEVVAREVSGHLEMGVQKVTGTPTFATTNIAVGQTVFIVVRHQIVPLNVDPIDIWINPPPGSFGGSDGSIPPPSATATDGSEDSSSTGPGRFYFASGANAYMDEFRMATTWAEVTPPAGSCDPAAITSDPTSKTVAAGVNANFLVAANGTSPAYQWQVKTNGGSVFVNVADGTGETTSSFTTPNLRLADSGNQYRAIVNVACNGGSSATSQVATVTVTNAIVSGVGLVVDDTWTDLMRTNAPVTTNNSVWYGASGLGDASTGTLIGTPAAGSSTLWVGYFADDSTITNPVSLAVGSTLKVTLTFSADNIFTNGGGAMRFGIYDYFDSGHVITNDTQAGGSGGLGTGVRGYMFTLEWGTNFVDTTPIDLFARANLPSANLMGTTGDYVSITNGPTVTTGDPAFVSGTPYTLEMTVTRTAFSSSTVGVKITGGSLNIGVTNTDSTFAYHRFDSLGIRANTLESTASQFNFTRFKAEVVASAAPPTPIPLTIKPSGATSVVLTWANPAFVLQAAPQVTGTYTNVTGGVSGYTTTAGGSQTFYRLIASP